MQTELESAEKVCAHDPWELTLGANPPSIAGNGPEGRRPDVGLLRLHERFSFDTPFLDEAMGIHRRGSGVQGEERRDNEANSANHSFKD